MEPGETIELEIERMSAGGDGLAFDGGKAVFVPLGAPGDRVLARVVQRKADFSRAEILSLLRPSPARVPAPCPHYGACGGCNLMHLDYKAQLSAKEAILADALRRVGKLGDPPVSVVPSPPFGYRNRAQFHVTADGKPGYARRSSAELLPVGECRILAEPLGSWLRRAAAGGGDWARVRRSLAGRERFLAFGAGDGVWLEGVDGELSVPVLGKGFRFHVSGFFQSNLAMLELLVPEATAGLSGARAADLYCGVGLFGAFLKERFGRVTCVEQDARAVGYAFQNVGKDADFAAAGMEEWTKSPQARHRYDHVLVDPPRAGLAPPVKAWLASSRPPSVGYVSCDPVSLARDAGELCRAGYELESVKGFDFYPQTAHLESYARFRLL